MKRNRILSGAYRWYATTAGLSAVAIVATAFRSSPSPPIFENATHSLAKPGRKPGKTKIVALTAK